MLTSSSVGGGARRTRSKSSSAVMTGWAATPFRILAWRSLVRAWGEEGGRMRTRARRRSWPRRGSQASSSSLPGTAARECSGASRSKRGTYRCLAARPACAPEQRGPRVRCRDPSGAARSPQPGRRSHRRTFGGRPGGITPIHLRSFIPRPPMLPTHCFQLVVGEGKRVGLTEGVVLVKGPYMIDHSAF
jgi:hypothetical protein